MCVCVRVCAIWSCACVCVRVRVCVCACVCVCVCTIMQPPPHADDAAIGASDGNVKYQLHNTATGRCLTVAPVQAGNESAGNRVVLLPCNKATGGVDLNGLWEFDRGVSTVTTISSAVTGQVCTKAFLPPRVLLSEKAPVVAAYAG